MTSFTILSFSDKNVYHYFLLFSMSMCSSVALRQKFARESSSSHFPVWNWSVYPPPHTGHSNVRVPAASHGSYDYYHQYSNSQNIAGIPFLLTSPFSKNVLPKEKKAKKTFACEICKATFKRPSAIKVHMRIHSGEKPYQCRFCPKAFSQSGNLTVHLRKHTGEKPYGCVICLKRFTQSNSLKVHVRTHTEEKQLIDRWVELILKGLSWSLSHSGEGEGALTEER